MSDLELLACLLLSAAATIALIIALAVFMAVQLNGWDCRGYHRVTGLPTKMQASTCYVQEDGRWMSWDERVVRNATAGAK